MDLKNKKVSVIGLGNSGINASLLLNSLGAEVWASDCNKTDSTEKAKKLLEKKGVKAETGAHTELFIKESDLIVLSPGVEDSSPPLLWAAKSGIPVIGEMELGFRFCKGRIIAITGTNGKSTVTSLIGEILKNAGKDVVVCGNIGNSLCGEIGRINKDTWVVMETSSFQLERAPSFKPQIAVILNITDDHLDRYRDFGDYYSEKLKIFHNQDKGDILILNYDAGNLRSLKDKAGSRVFFYSRFKKVEGVYAEDGWIFRDYAGKIEKIMPCGEAGIKGTHNTENVLASALASSLAGAGKKAITDAVKSFKGLSHRCEKVAVVNGVEYIDDSKGTTVDSTLRALESCDKPVVLIAGGKDKNSDYNVIKDMIRSKVKHLVLIGEAKSRIRKALEGAADIYDASDMNNAVEIASTLAKKGYIVILSPMCSSFDMFKDYKERGNAFKKAVRQRL